MLPAIFAGGGIVVNKGTECGNRRIGQSVRNLVAEVTPSEFAFADDLVVLVTGILLSPVPAAGCIIIRSCKLAFNGVVYPL